MIFSRTLFFIVLLAQSVIGVDIFRDVNISTLHAPKMLKQLYLQHQNNLFWVQGTVLNTDMKASLDKIREDIYINYKQKLFHTKDVEILLSNELNTTTAALLDIYLTDTYLSLYRFAQRGDMDWDGFMGALAKQKELKDQEVHWERYAHYEDVVQSVYSTLLSQTIKVPSTPSHPQYKKLIDGYQVYRKFAQKPQQVVRYDENYTLGDKDKRRIYTIRDFKKRLAQSLDIPFQDEYSNVVDAQTVEGIKKVQKRFGIKVTGVGDNVTVFYMNELFKDKLIQIELNIEKIKQLNTNLGDEYFRINIPTFSFRHIKDGRLENEINVVVGRKERPTPIFSDMMESIVLNPYWNIPENLVKKDLFSVMPEDPDYLKNHDIHVFTTWQDNSGEINIDTSTFDFEYYKKEGTHVPYRFVQFPGVNNPLGRVKFLFPNKYSVYLHDTDAKTLFSKRYKVYSSGCVRLEKPLELLDALLPYTALGIDEAHTILDGIKNKHLKLTKQIPVSIEYQTAFVDTDGSVNFRKDFYGYDKIQKEFLVHSH